MPICPLIPCHIVNNYDLFTDTWLLPVVVWIQVLTIQPTAGVTGTVEQTYNPPLSCKILPNVLSYRIFCPSKSQFQLAPSIIAQSVSSLSNKWKWWHFSDILSLYKPHRNKKLPSGLFTSEDIYSSTQFQSGIKIKLKHELPTPCTAPSFFSVQYVIPY